MVLVGVLAGSASAQTLNLGDPKPPSPSQLTAGREAARQLQRELEQIVAAAESTDGTEQVLAAARAKWRTIAALLLEHPDPLGDPETVLLGWGLMEHGAELDRAIRAVVHGDDLDVQQRGEALWELKRFAAVPFRDAKADVDSHSARPADMAEVRAAIRPLVEALTPAPDSAPADDALARRLALATARLAEDRDLAPLQAVVRRCMELRRHAGWRVEAEITLNQCLCLLEDVRVLDEAQWEGTVWQQSRSAAIAGALERLAAPRADALVRNSPGIPEFAELTRTLSSLSLLPPSARPQLEPFRRAAGRCIGESVSTGQPLAWPLLNQAIDSLRLRHGNLEAATQHELRIACKALDAQSDQLERMMGEYLNRPSTAGLASDPRWATVIGQHRENVGIRQTLIKLPVAIDWLEQYDRRAGGAIWPQLLPHARAVDDPRSRQALLVRAAGIVQFHDRHSLLPSEEDWRAADESLCALVGNQRERILEQLDSLRRMRSAEIVAGELKGALRKDLDAMYDLFRLVEVRRVLPFAEVHAAESGVLRHVNLPAGFAAEEVSRFDASLRSLFDIAATGGEQFVRAVESVRRDAASAVILADLVTVAENERTSTPPALIGLTAIAQSAGWGHAAHDAGRKRLAQWKVLQFEVRFQSDDHGAAAEDLKQYARFLAARMADALWAQ